MKTSFWRRWCDSLRGAKPTGRPSRVRPRRQPLCLEALEDRVTPSLTPQMVLDINPGIASSDPSQMAAIGSTTYFAADDGVHGVELWKSDGTAAGTVLVKDINPGSASSDPTSLTNVNGTLFFTTYNATTGYALWKSDGTAAGTVPVSFGFFSAGYLTNVDGTLFFSADDLVHGAELWKSDGTAAGTTLVKDIWPGGESGYYGGYSPNSSSPMNLTNVNGTLFFSALDGTHAGPGLWKSDGTATGTTLVKDFSSIGGSFAPSLTNVNGTLFFSADEGIHGSELWKSDGTAAGTTLVKDIYSGSSGSYPSALANVNAMLFFSARNTTTGWELWKSDGTAAGTILIKDINQGTASSTPIWLTNVNGTLFFSASNATTGSELWKSDGTAAGTVLVKDINPGNASSSPTWLTNVNGTLFFSADDGIHGRELWMLIDDAPTQGTSLDVSGFPATITAGVAGSFTVTQKNPDGTTNTSYRGTVHFASTDPQAVLPGNYTFTAADAGTHTFSATLKTAGSQSLTATDTANGALTGIQGILVNAAAASRLVLSAPASVKANTGFRLTVTVVDAYGNVATGYRGTLSFSSWDATANLPKKYTFTAADQGVHTFTGLILRKKGTQKITLTDTLNSSLTGSVIENVL